MCILCTIKAWKLGDRIMIESFLAVISYWTTGHMFSMGWFARSKVDDHDAWCDLCARKHLGSQCVWCQETNQVKKTARKDFKVYGIKIVRIFLGSYRIPNMVLQMSSVLGWHLCFTSCSILTPIKRWHVCNLVIRLSTITAFLFFCFCCKTYEGPIEAVILPKKYDGVCCLQFEPCIRSRFSWSLLCFRSYSRSWRRSRSTSTVYRTWWSWWTRQTPTSVSPRLTTPL